MDPPQPTVRETAGDASASDPAPGELGGRDRTVLRGCDVHFAVLTHDQRTKCEKCALHASLPAEGGRRRDRCSVVHAPIVSPRPSRFARRIGIGTKACANRRIPPIPLLNLRFWAAPLHTPIASSSRATTGLIAVGQTTDRLDPSRAMVSAMWWR